MLRITFLRKVCVGNVVLQHKGKQSFKQTKQKKNKTKTKQWQTLFKMLYFYRLVSRGGTLIKGLSDITSNCNGLFRIIFKQGH